MAKRIVRKPSAAPKGAYQLVIVESPAKAKTIEKYLGKGFEVRASIGHIRDLPSRAPKGTKQPVPGVDLETFDPTYVVHEGKGATVTELRRLAKAADDVWFATDLDREGEAIAWHLAVVLGIDPSAAKRVVFDAVVKADVQEAFTRPRAINMNRVDAQQARRILDRVVGYLVSPVLWKKVAGGLSAGRVQTPATRLIVDRERAIAAFTPDESWEFHATLTMDPNRATELGRAWDAFLAQRDERDRGPLVRDRMKWLADHASLECELVEVGGASLKIAAEASSKADLSSLAKTAATAAGLLEVSVTHAADDEGRGRAQRRSKLSGRVDPKARYTVSSIETTRTKSRPYPPFTTSTLQQAAAGRLGFATDRTMRVAQQLYEGIDVPGEGRVGLISYMRTDSTHLSREAVLLTRGFIKDKFGEPYLPAAPRIYSTKSQGAQEAHEAIRPTDPRRTPESLASCLTEEQQRLYGLIWRGFVACQMVDAEWDSTTIRFLRSDAGTGAVLKANGRVLAFDGCYRAAGVPSSDAEQTLPLVKEGAIAAPIALEGEQKFSSPPPRFSEATLVKALESEGIGRPSTYASIIRVIQEREYVEQVDRRFHATDLGMAVTDFLVQGFATNFVEIDFTRRIEEELDEIAQGKEDWRAMLKGTTKILKPLLTAAMTLPHAKSVLEPAAYACPQCGARTEYRLGKNGRFLSCSAYPECKFANPVDRRGQPLMPEQLDLLSPKGVPMIKRHGRFGEFLVEDLPYAPPPRKKAAKRQAPSPVVDRFILNIDKKGCLKLPAPKPVVVDQSCPRCQSKLNLREGKRGPWLGCSAFPKCKGRESFAKLDEALQATLKSELAEHLRHQPKVVVTRRDGTPVEDGTPIDALAIPGGVVTLATHPDHLRDRARTPARKS